MSLQENAFRIPVTSIFGGGGNKNNGILIPDDEAVVDLGGTSNVVNIHYEPEELEGHRTLYVGVRMPLVRQAHRHHRNHGQKHRKRDRVKESVSEDQESHDTPSQRVQFILGMEEDEEHVPHDLFTEMDEICVKEGEESEWKETARWLKFEEDVEHGGERWSKPYVATLSLHSLFELRSCIINGIVLLDMCANTIEDIADQVLLHGVLQSQSDSTLKVCLSLALLSHLSNANPNILLARHVELHFMKKIPVGAEASNVLVGEVDFLTRPLVAFVRLSPAVLLPGMTEVPLPTRFFFLLLGPIGKGKQYHEIGRSMATLMTDEIFHDVAYKAKDRSDLLAGFDEFLDQVTVLPPGEWDPSIRIEPPKNLPSQEKRKMPGPPGVPNGSVCHEETEDDRGPELQRTGRLFGGLILDVKRKIPWYWSDFKDGLSFQCLASFLFLYCASMSPVITFGGLLGEATDGQISAIESLLGASLTGVVYSLFAGQPLTILGSTGPVLVFEKILFTFCKDYGFSYLSLRSCIGLWTAFLCVVLVATDASSLVCYITRFTEEAFASLICLIFIVESLEKLLKLGRKYPVHMNSDLDQLTLYYCRCSAPQKPNVETLDYWNSHNITSSTVPWPNLTVSQCHEMHGEFTGSACAADGPFTPNVLFWCTILFFATFILSSLLKQFKSSNYFPTKVRSIVGDFAIFITIVIMVLIDYLVGIPSPKLNVPNSFQPTNDDRGWVISPLGPNPWWTMVASIIPALLCTILIFMDQQITAVIVNRKEHKLKKGCGYHLDLLMVGIMLGVCSVMGLPWFVAATVLSISHVNSLKEESTIAAPGDVLKFIPMPVLYGVFLYMGASSLRGIQFFDRLKLIGMPTKHQPDFIYLRHVPLRKVHLFTAIQLICLILLWVIKASPAAVIFPMMILALVFVRKVMDFCFTKRELSWLDDLMPESKKKRLDDEKTAAEEEVSKYFLNVQINLSKFLYVNCRPDPADINISDEMPKTTVWKALSMNTEKL
uniref:Anion exchange protein n=1 Tax=Anolis carolinensis TaxID=28377 RepID=G1KLH8_ANOCA